MAKLESVRSFFLRRSEWSYIRDTQDVNILLHLMWRTASRMLVTPTRVGPVFEDFSKILRLEPSLVSMKQHHTDSGLQRCIVGEDHPRPNIDGRTNIY